jgi:hypothetical protein
MKTILSMSVLAVLLLVGPPLCFGSMLVEQVPKERAKQLGIEVRAKANGPSEAWIQLEFKPKGELKNFVHVSLEIREGEKCLLGYSPLKEKRSDSGSIVVSFLADRAYMEKISLSVITGQPMNYTGHELRVKDFVDLGKLP